MLYDVVCERRGKREVVFTGDLPKAHDYVKKMSACQRGGIRGQRVSYVITESDETTKYKKPPHYPNGRAH